MGGTLVTGAAGQIGSHLCQELVSRGEGVIACDVRPGPSGTSAGPVDITDRERLLEVAKAQRPEALVHLAAVVFLDSMQNPGLAYRVNVLGTSNVLEAARLADVRKVVFASSVLVYGAVLTKRPGIADEDDVPNPPSDPYCTSKIACELMGRFYREKQGIDVTCLRVAAAWGPGRYTGYTGQFNDYIRKVATGSPAAFPADFAYAGAKLRWLYVKDVAKAFADASQARKPASYIFNTGSREPFRARDVAGALNSALPGESVTIEETGQPTSLSSTVAGPNGLDIDCSRLYGELGFTPRFSLRTAMKDMVDHERSAV